MKYLIEYTTIKQWNNYIYHGLNNNLLFGIGKIKIGILVMSSHIYLNNYI